VKEPVVETLGGWGDAHFGQSWTYRPRSVEDVGQSITDAQRRGLSIAHRGAGLSYGDAAINQDGAVIVLDQLQGIKAFDPTTGVITAEAGVTLAQLWRYVLSHRWWPPVVSGTMHTTLGGGVAMNVHGKNNAQAGPIGDHVRALTVMEPSGDVVRISREENAGRLRTVIGAQGMNGTILDVTLQLTRIHSGYLEVEQHPVPSLEVALERLDAGIGQSDYAVGWLDCFGRGPRSGRGVLHFARYLPPDHSLAGTGLRVPDQELWGRVLGVIPRQHVWRFLRMATHDPGLRALNLAKYTTGRLRGTRTYMQSHVAFHFLLDYIPQWKRIYQPRGFIQYQFFVPSSSARAVFQTALDLQHRAGIVSYLAVLKRHRLDDSAATYSVDGFSLALDFPLKPQRAEALTRLCREFDALQRDSGGRIYAAKDSVSIGRLPVVRALQYSSNLVRRWEREIAM